ncbi:MAG: hypothetical protein ACXWRZ_01445 [Bdellovibrio sp.]
MAQAVFLKLLQKEFSELPSAVAMAPMAMAAVTLLIVISHIIVNADQFNFEKPIRKILTDKLKAWWDLFKSKM